MSEIKQNRYRNFFKKNLKSILIIGMIIVLVVLLLNDFFKVTYFKLEDKCGRFVNLVSHTIDNENACKSRCRAQCQSVDKQYSKVQFVENFNSCNLCTCYCK